MDIDQEKLDEIYKLTRDNNKMLHSMRRNAFLGGILKLLIYAAFIVIPLWFYYTYLGPQVQKILAAADAVQGTGAQAQVQLSQFQDMIKGIQDKIPSLSLPQ